MSRYRLIPSPAQEGALRNHCAHARFVWNLAVEQHLHWRRSRASAPGYLEQCRQLTAARKDNPWLAAGSQMVQQQALRDFAQAMANFFAGTHRRPTCDRAGRWHIAFAVVPQPIPAPGNDLAVGIDRGIVVSAALSTGELLHAPGLTAKERKRLHQLERRLARAGRGSNRRNRLRLAIARMRARETDRRKDWAEKASTDIARRFDLIRVEDLQIGKMTRSARGTVGAPGRNVLAKAGLNREILRSGWGLMVHRLMDKASGRVEKISPAFSSQRCSACGHVDAKSRESQARFVCTACSFACNADVNAAKNIAAGLAVTARGGDGITRPVNREPQLLLQSA
jgi:putative transposase